MFYIRTSKAGAFAQACANAELSFTLRPSLTEGLVRVDTPQDLRCYDVAAQVEALPETGQPRWLGDRRRADDEDQTEDPNHAQ